MKFFPFIVGWAFGCHKVRAVLTIFSVVVAFVLFAYLSAIRRGFGLGAEIAGADRLIVRHKASLTRLLPRIHEEDIRKIAGVSAATHSTFLVGIYKEPFNIFPQFAVDPDEFLAMKPDYVLPQNQKEQWLRTRNGAVVGRGTAERFGFRIGNRIPIRGTVWQPRHGGAWMFDLVGIYDGAHDETDISNFLFRYDYFDESRTSGKGMVSVFLVRVADPASSTRVSQEIDSLYENSSHPTKTESEAALLRGLAGQIGNIGSIVVVILVVVFITMLMIVGNTVAEGVRERLKEFAVLKAIGFTDGQLLWMVFCESSLIALTGAAAGLALGALAVAAQNPLRGILPAFVFHPHALLAGIAMAGLLAVAAGAMPAVQVMRLDTAAALRTD